MWSDRREAARAAGITASHWGRGGRGSVGGVGGWREGGEVNVRHMGRKLTATLAPTSPRRFCSSGGSGTGGGTGGGGSGGGGEVAPIKGVIGAAAPKITCGHSESHVLLQNKTTKQNTIFRHLWNVGIQEREEKREEVGGGRRRKKARTCALWPAVCMPIAWRLAATARPVRAD